MKKEDLKNGSILETKSGEHCVKIGNYLYFIESGFGTTLYRFDYNLKAIDGDENDIMKVCLEPMKSNKWDWIRKEMPKLTKDEKYFLKSLDSKWKWIARSNLGGIFIFIDKPIKNNYDDWIGSNYFYCGELIKLGLFSFISNEDEKPYNIKKLLIESES